MLWQESDADSRYVVPDTVQDLAFALECRQLPVDHADALRAAVLAELPWLADEPLAGIHQIHVAESGNGWFRPDDETQMLCLSKRTKLHLRLPAHRLEQAIALSGREIEVAGQTMRVGKAKPRTLSTQGTVFARYVALPEHDEDRFIAHAAERLRERGVTVRKAMCGRTHVIQTASGHLETRSLMIADLKPDEAVRVQQTPLGEGRLLGCGLFLPHKGIEAVKSASDQQSG
ncbi:MAG: type I-MYXAN CRISPR-associated protein Cas6/Cmx6 [Chromatiales bacterium]|nr:type I-MYXAN CRISPR-associated protein Cas6/Cmx6 [Chromatiales bacterium]